MKKNILFLGESYVASHTYFRGANYVTLPEYANTGQAFAGMLRGQGFAVDHLPTHSIPAECPATQAGFSRYDAVIISDVASDTMLSPPPTAPGKRATNRLAELADYVRAGGGLLMCGGYFSFSGVGNQARYGMTPLAEVLPVVCSNYDDRIECPEGVIPQFTDKPPALLAGMPSGQWPAFKGYNRTAAKPGAEVFARFAGDPFLVGGEFGKGRSFAFLSDCEPNWATHEFLDWPGYPLLFRKILEWIMRDL